MEDTHALPPRAATALLSGVALLLLATAHPALGSSERLPAYNVDLAQTSVSGISSGGYMAVQFGVAHSSVVTGVGVFAGGPYACAAGGARTALSSCMQADPAPTLDAAVAATERAAAAQRIDATDNLARQKIWLFSGYNDGVVKQQVMDVLAAYYRHYAAPGNVFYQDTLPAGHALISEDFGGECPATGGTFINDCDYDAAGLLLQHVYGRLEPPTEGTLGGRIVAFDQDEFVAGSAPQWGLARTAYAYVPAACAEGERCRVHVAFHGCLQYASRIGDAFYRHAGYNRWADGNHIIVLYPQTVASTLGPLNPKGCWDWWGYNVGHYASREGKQIAAVRAMLVRLAQGAPVASTSDGAADLGAPRGVSVGDAADDEVALFWDAVGAAQEYHVSRADGPDAPFQRITERPVSGASFADTGLRPATRYAYRVSAVASDGTQGPPSAAVGTSTSAPAPACDPYFTDNDAHVTKGRAVVWWGFAYAKGSGDALGLWNVFTESALHRVGDEYRLGPCR